MRRARADGGTCASTENRERQRSRKALRHIIGGCRPCVCGRGAGVCISTIGANENSIEGRMLMKCRPVGVEASLLHQASAFCNGARNIASTCRPARVEGSMRVARHFFAALMKRNKARNAAIAHGRPCGKTVAFCYKARLWCAEAIFCSTIFIASRASAIPPSPSGVMTSASSRAHAIFGLGGNQHRKERVIASLSRHGDIRLRASTAAP